MEQTNKNGRECSRNGAECKKENFEVVIESHGPDSSL